MKKILLSLAIMAQCAAPIYAQSSTSKIITLGTVNQLVNQLNQRTGETVKLTLADGSVVNADVKFRSRALNEIHLQGVIPGNAGANFNLDIKDGKVEGRVFLPGTYKAYVYADVNGNVVVKEADIRKLVCVDYPVAEEAADHVAQRPTDDPDVSNLQSNPGAGGCLLLDFNGYEMPAGNYWNGGNAISAATSGMSSEDMLKAWQIVAEDFFPFNLNVTTSEAVFATYAQNKRSRCVVTPTNYFFPGAAGVAFTGSFLFNNESPCWIFTSGTGLGGKRVGEACAHELGHTLGLSHDGITGADYYGGHGNWAPIMGNSLSKPVSQWSKGEYNGATNFEDDISIIAGTSNGVGYRLDDHQSTLANATPILHNSGTLTTGQNTGFIGRNDDIDAFSFTSTGGNTAFVIKAKSAFTDIRLGVTLYNASGTEIASYLAPANDLTTPLTVNQTLAPGVYYLSITGTAAGTASADYNDYSSLGTYDLFGSFNNTPLAVSISPLTAKIIDAKNTLLNWKTYSEQNNAGFTVQRSTDGKIFNNIGSVQSQTADGNSAAELQYNYTDNQSVTGTTYYRLIQTDKDGKATYSDVVTVNRASDEALTMQTYPNPATSTLTVQLKGKLAEGTEMMMTDMAGRVVLKQAVTASVFTLDMNAMPTGMYLLKYVGADATLVSKILKK
ncbi:MAG: T9SS type A sorting domain-containing protein, partial [Sphingobacteriales bacterium]